MVNEQQKVYQALLRSNATCLPIDPFKFRVDGYQWEIHSKYEARKKGILKNDILNEAADEFVAFTFEDLGKHYIIYDDKLSSGERSLDIMHEAAHIIYGHTSDNSIVGKSHDPLTVSSRKRSRLFFFNIFRPTLRPRRRWYLRPRLKFESDACIGKPRGKNSR